MRCCASAFLGLSMLFLCGLTAAEITKINSKTFHALKKNHTDLPLFEIATPASEGYKIEALAYGNNPDLLSDAQCCDCSGCLLSADDHVQKFKITCTEERDTFATITFTTGLDQQIEVEATGTNLYYEFDERPVENDSKKLDVWHNGTYSDTSGSRMVLLACQELSTLPKKPYKK